MDHRPPSSLISWPVAFAAIGALALYLHSVFWWTEPRDLSLFLKPWFDHLVHYGPVGAFATRSAITRRPISIFSPAPRCSTARSASCTSSSCCRSPGRPSRPTPSISWSRRWMARRSGGLAVRHALGGHQCRAPRPMRRPVGGGLRARGRGDDPRPHRPLADLVRDRDRLQGAGGIHRRRSSSAR